MSEPEVSFEFADIDRDREAFLLDLLSDLADVLQHNIGLDEAEGFVSMVGNRTGLIMNNEYQAVAGVKRLSVAQVAAAIVDLKRRVGGGFRIESVTDEAIVLVNDKCPFGEHVIGRPSLCMMTSNLFGRIAADNLGYANVVLDQAIARGDRGCRVTIRLDGSTSPGKGREYFG